MPCGKGWDGGVVRHILVSRFFVCFDDWFRLLICDNKTIKMQRMSGPMFKSMMKKGL